MLIHVACRWRDLRDVTSLPNGDLQLKIVKQPAGLPGDLVHIKEIHELHEMMVKEKKSVVLGNMSSNIFQTICATSGLSPRTSAQPPIQSEAKSIDVYSWDDSIEPSQLDRYLAHLKESFSINGRIMGWVDCRKHPSMLSLEGLSLIGHNLRGTTDVAIVTRQAHRQQKPQMGLLIMFELKKKALESRCAYKASASLIAASIHSPDERPVMVLTDLGSVWQVMWMNGLTIFTHMFESTEEAAGCIQKIIDAGPASAVQPEAKLPEGTWSFSKRRRVDLRRTAPSWDVGPTRPSPPGMYG
ncbi:hypothetical protein WJX84_004940 [Apatococcus fuscideae]|uniref:Uncharacterized protein n=1 Tax=Apatococcus fuscideae TaxID=2026836 RepID=A0AAW1RJS5_9CHLO